jgi:hypothetical protein
VRLASLLNGKSDDPEINKKIKQVCLLKKCNTRKNEKENKLRKNNCTKLND